jgi:hypothetical protein
MAFRITAATAAATAATATTSTTNLLAEPLLDLLVVIGDSLCQSLLDCTKS